MNDRVSLKLVIENLGNIATPRAQRWSHVGNLLSLGSTSAITVCRLQGVDPFEVIGSDFGQCWECDDFGKVYDGYCLDCIDSRRGQKAVDKP
jgi:hypothetical protein